jgi:hypothetical protein
MSAAARPKRWSVSRQAKGQEFGPTNFEFLTLLDGACYLGYLGYPGEAKGKRNDIHKLIASDGSELIPTTEIKNNLILPKARSSRSSSWRYPDIFLGGARNLRGKAVDRLAPLTRVECILPLRTTLMSKKGKRHTSALDATANQIPSGQPENWDYRRTSKSGTKKCTDNLPA